MVKGAVAYHVYEVVVQGKGGDVTGFRSFDNSTDKRVLNLLEAGNLRLG